MKHITTFFFLLLASTGSLAMIESEVKVQDDIDGVAVNLKNTMAEDYLCGEIKINVKLCNSNFCEQASECQFIRQNVYLRGLGSLQFNISNLTKTNQASSDSWPLVKDSKLDLVSCRPAHYKDYCQFADKSPAESHTLDVIGYVLNTNPCEMEPQNITTLKLENQEIESVAPITFFTQLEHLNLQSNNVTSLAGLDKLIRLKTVDLDINPDLMELAPLLTLPVIERIWARETGLLSVGNEVRSPSLKHVVLQGKARTCEIRYFDEKNHQEVVIECDKPRK